MKNKLKNLFKKINQIKIDQDQINIKQIQKQTTKKQYEIYYKNQKLSFVIEELNSEYIGYDTKYTVNPIKRTKNTRKDEEWNEFLFKKFEYKIFDSIDKAIKYCVNFNNFFVEVNRGK